MKKKFTTYALSGLALIAAAGVTKAQITVEKPLEAFSKIQASGGAYVFYVHSDTARIKMTGTSGEMENAEYRQADGTLYLTTKGRYNEGFSIYIYNNQLNEVSCSGAMNFKTRNTVPSDSITFHVSGSSNLSAKLSAAKVSLKQNGATNVTLTGTTVVLKAEVDGASELKAYNLASSEATVTASGASTAKINVSKRVVARGEGASAIKIKGDAKDVFAEAGTASSITRIVASKGDVNAGDSTTIRWKGKKIIIVESDKEEKKIQWSNNTDFDHWAGFAVGVNGLLTPDASLNMEKLYSYMDLNYARSINLQLNIFQHNFHLYKNYVNLVTGFGIEWRRYMLEHKTNLWPDSSFTFGSIDSTNTFRYNKNLFKSTLLQVPLLLDFNTSKKSSKSFHVSMGVIGQFMVNSKTKQKLESNGFEFTKINKDDYNMNPLNLKAHASIGYSSFTVFAEYNITRLFAKNEGPQLYPFVAGIRVVPL